MTPRRTFKVIQPRRIEQVTQSTDAGASPIDVALTATSAVETARLLETGPVHRGVLPNGIPVWLVVGHAEALAALNEPLLSLATNSGEMGGGDLAPEILAGMSSSLLNSDPPDHTRLRRLVSSVFTARRIEAMRPWISGLTDSLIDVFADRGEADLVAELATPLPIQVICELLGIPHADRGAFREWSNAFVAGVGSSHYPVAQVTEFVLYLRELVARKRTEPDDGLLSALIQARDEQQVLSEDELTSLIFLLIIAGHDTTLSLVGNGLFLLLTHPEQAAQLRAAPGRIADAVEEFLRLETPVPLSTFRIATGRVELGGAVLEPGDIVIVDFQAANRDASMFPDPAGLDLHRAAGRHLAFGHGIHYCLGAPLARLEGELAIGAMLRRFPDLRLAIPAEKVPRRAGMFMHGLESLPVRLGREDS
jgi:cytochrome P450